MHIAPSREELRKMRAINGAWGTVMRVEKYTPEEIIVNSYVHTENEVAYELTKRIEYMLLLAKTQPEIYKKRVDELLLKISDWIKENGYYREWVDFIYFMNVSKYSEKTTLIDAYLSIMMDIWNYLTDYKPENIYGLTSGDQLLICDELYGDWDKKLVSIHKELDKNPHSKKSKDKLRDFMNSKEYSQLNMIEKNENMTDINIFEMIPFINERTKDIFPQKWFPLAETKYYKKPRQWKPTEFYKEQLQKRKYILDRKGVKVYLKNAGRFTEIFFKEDVTKDRKIAMLYRLTVPEGSFMGYYHLQDQNFFSPYKQSSEKSINYEIENFVLELYTEIVCGLEKDRKRIYAIMEVDDIDNIPDYRDTHVYVQYQLYNKETDREELNGHKRGFKQKAHERSHSIRKLKEGFQASEEAIIRAQEMGIELQEGYTYVKNYSVGVTKDDIRTEIKPRSERMRKVEERARESME